MNRRATRIKTFDVCVPTHVALRMFIMQVLASPLHFLANRNADLTVPPLLWPVNCIKIGGHVELLSGPTVHSLFFAYSHWTKGEVTIGLESPSLRRKSTIYLKTTKS